LLSLELSGSFIPFLKALQQLHIPIQWSNKMTKEDFTLFPKRLASGNTIYYYWLYDESGKRRQFSTGTSDYKSALKVCRDRLLDNQLVPNSETQFSQFTKDWFIPGKCPYCRTKEIRGFKLSATHIQNQRSVLISHIQPFMGDIDLRMINRMVIEQWLQYLSAKGLSNTTINHYITTLNLIMSEARRYNLISMNPLKDVQRFKSDTKEKGILTPEEWQELFLSDKKGLYWDDCLWAYTFCLLASLTAMRRGELQALRWENVYPDRIHVKYSWSSNGLKGTKTDKERIIPISSEVYKLIVSSATSRQGFLFSWNQGLSPMDYKGIIKHYYSALEQIGIDDENRRYRNITFHSFRHFANTRLRASGLSDMVVQSVTGHQDMKMTEHYTHLAVNDLGALQEYQRDALTLI